ncbi:hypothetical protein LTR08_005989 [Meristemomyces frigidus]|nr:hypothetical protein LTR08_005989 [Meristemomyces frigidus]
MAKSARASSVKKNNTGLKKRVFGPVEIARSERLSAKLLALAQQPKPPRPEKMEVEKDGRKDVGAKEDKTADETMDVDGAVSTAKKGNGFRLARNVKQRDHKAARVGKSTHRKPRNNILFKKSGRAKKGGK